MTVSFTTRTGLFTSGETVSAYLNGDDTLPAATTAVAAGTGAVTFPSLTDDRRYKLKGGSSGAYVFIYTDVVASVGSGSVATDLLFDAVGDLAVGSGSNTAVRLPVGTDGFALVADSSVSGVGVKWAAISGSGILASTVDVKGDLIAATANDAVARLAAGANDTVLIADSAQTAGLKYAQIANAQVSASAAIAYSKLNLSASIVNADVAGAAAIAYSKLNLANSIVGGDISTTSTPRVASLGVGMAAPGAAGTMVASTYAGADNGSGSYSVMNGTGLIDTTLLTSTTVAWNVAVNGDVAAARYQVLASGKVLWGGGTNAVDVALERAAAGSLRVTPSANVTPSPSAGGALNITNTANTGDGLVIYSAHATPNSGSKLLEVTADNAGFGAGLVRVDSKVGANSITTMQVYQRNTTAANPDTEFTGAGAVGSMVTLDVSSRNIKDTTVGITGYQGDVGPSGTLKVTHNKPASADASCAAISILLDNPQSSGTSSGQGIFLDTANSGAGSSAHSTTAKLLNIRNAGTERLTLTGAGDAILTGQFGVKLAAAPQTSIAVGMASQDGTSAGTATTGIAVTDYSTGFTAGGTPYPYLFASTYTHIATNTGSPATKASPGQATKQLVQAAVSLKGAGAPGGGGFVGIGASIFDRAEVQSKTITSVAAGVVTCGAHTLTVGERVAVYGTTIAGYEGVWTVSAVGATTVTLSGGGGLGSGAFTGTIRNAPSYNGLSAIVSPSVDRTFGVSADQAFNSDDVCGVAILNSGTAKGTDALYICDTPTVSGAGWITLISSPAPVDFGFVYSGTISANGWVLDFHSATIPSTGGGLWLPASNGNVKWGTDVSMYRAAAGNLVLDISAGASSATVSGVGVALQTTATASQTGVIVGATAPGTLQSIALGTGGGVKAFALSGNYTVSGTAPASILLMGTNITPTITLDGTSTTNLRELRGHSFSPTINMTSAVTYGQVSTSSEPVSAFRSAIVLTAQASSDTATITSLDHFSVGTSASATGQTVGLGWTVTTWRGLYVGTPAGSGIVTTFVGVDISDLNAFAGTKTNTPISIRSVSTTLEMQHAGPIRVGATGSPAASCALDVRGNIIILDGSSITSSATTTGLKVGGASDKLGFFNATPIARPAAYTNNNASPSRTLNAAGSETLANTSAVLSSLVNDLKAGGSTGVGLVG